MNLESTPSLNELQTLVAACDDSAGNHVLWVDVHGTVHITLLGPDMTPAGFAQSRDDLKLRYETYCAGNGYVGFKAAQDAGYVSGLLADLQRDWTKLKDAPGQRYIDY